MGCSRQDIMKQSADIQALIHVVNKNIKLSAAADLLVYEQPDESFQKPRTSHDPVSGWFKHLGSK